MKGIYNLLDRHTIWWNIFILIIDSNVNFTTFCGFVQLLMPGSFSFLDKANLLVTVLYIFINLVFNIFVFTCIYKRVSK